METREQLLEQHADWTAKYIEADRRLKDLHPPLKGLSKGKQLAVQVPTKESLAEFKKAKRDANRALDKLHGIMEKLYKLR